MGANRYLVVGSCLLVAGAVLPFLMVIGVLPSPLWLSFVVFACTVGGGFVGILGLAMAVAERRRRDDGTV